MKTISQIMLLSASVLALASCNKTETNNDTKVALAVSGNVANSMPVRAVNATWESGDAIGIFMTDGATTNNSKYTTADGGAAFAPAAADQTIWFPIDETAKVGFVAYYPYDALQTTLTLVVNVANQSDQKKLDLMTADKIINRDKTNPAVAFTFKHRLTKLTLTLSPGTGVVAADLSGLAIALSGQQTEGSCDLSTGTITPSGVATTVTMKTAADGLTSQATILPGVATAGRFLTFTLSSGDVFTYEIPASRAFSAGEHHKYAITLNRTSVQVTSTITDWIGVTEENGTAN